MNSSVKKWINGKADYATFKIDITKVPTGHKNHRGGNGIHDNRPNRLRTRSSQKRNAFKDWNLS